MRIKLSTPPSHSILTPGRPVPALGLYRQAPGRVASGVPIFKSLVCLDPGKSRRKRDSNPGSSALEADALTAKSTVLTEKMCIPSRPTPKGGTLCCRLFCFGFYLFVCFVCLFVCFFVVVFFFFLFLLFLRSPLLGEILRM